MSLLATIIIPTVAATTTSSVVLCQNQNTCSNQGVCYLVSGVIRCICPQGKQIKEFLKVNV